MLFVCCSARRVLIADTHSAWAGLQTQSQLLNSLLQRLPKHRHFQSLRTSAMASCSCHQVNGSLHTFLCCNWPKAQCA